MNRTSTALHVLLSLGLAAFAGPACAQFGTAAFPRAIEVGQGPSAAVGQNMSVVFYPVAAFKIDFASSTVTKYGVLASVEKAFPHAEGRQAEVLGGWIWSGGDAAIYEAHAKHYFTPEWGVQGGVIGGTRVSGFVTDGFVLYNLDGKRLAPGTRTNWSMQFGAGGHGGQSSGFTGYWQGSVEISPTWTVNASYWYIRESPFDFHRFTLGVGARF